MLFSGIFFLFASNCCAFKCYSIDVNVRRLVFTMSMLFCNAKSAFDLDFFVGHFTFAPHLDKQQIGRVAFFGRGLRGGIACP